ncbi:hypothetical protein [Rhodanobacter umsongensis]
MDQPFRRHAERLIRQARRNDSQRTLARDAMVAAAAIYVGREEDRRRRIGGAALPGTEQSNGS